MSIADELNKVIPELTEAYAAIEEMGGTVPAQKNYKNLAMAIESIDPKPHANAYAILYSPANPDLEWDWVDNASSISAVMSGSSSLPNTKKHTHLKFTEKCQELGMTVLNPIGGIANDITTIEGMSNFVKVTRIGNNFMDYTATNITSTIQSITDWPPNVTTIGFGFLYLCVNLNSPITISEKVTTVGEGFMFHCDSFVGPLTVNTSAVPDRGTTTQDQRLNFSGTWVPAYTTGVTVNGTYASAWKSALPNSSTGSVIRRLI